MRISPTTLELIMTLRDAIQQDGGSASAIAQELSKLPDFEGSKATAGYRITPEGDITDDHWWVIMSDGSILDASDEEPARCSKKDPRYGRYFPYTGETGIPMEVLQAADHLRAKSRTSKNKSFSTMVGEASEEPYIDGHLSGNQIAWVDMLYVPRNMRGTGVGTKMYLDWEKRLPSTVERVIIHVSDTEGEGQPFQFWDTLGFESPFFIPHWMDISEVHEDDLASMWKGVNGHPTPKPKEYELEDDDLGEASGASAPSGVARQAPEALPDAMTMDGKEGIPVDAFDDETKPEDLQMGWQDLVGEDEGDTTIDDYSCGKCMWLALALNQKYGWDIRAQIHHDDEHGDYVAHAYNVLPNGKEVDVLGVQDQVDIFSSDETRDMTADEMYDFLGVEPNAPEVKKHLQAAADIIDIHMNLKEVDHPDYMPDGENGTDNYDPTYDERSVHTNAGWPRP